MPMVGTKKFAYTEKGKKEAKEYAKKTGKDGSMYRGYFCPAPKGAFDKCKNVYLKTSDSAWNTFVPDQVK